MQKNKFSWRRFLFSFPVRCLVTIAIILSGFVHPGFFILGGLLALFYALPVLILGCCMIIAIEGMDNHDKHGKWVLLVLIASIAVPVFLIMHGFSLL